MSNSIRGNNVAPGIYFKEEEVSYNAKSLGITTLGVAGETLKGPAFEPVSISGWDEFQRVFGGTSTEKFRDSQFPKFELPFIAKSYLSESKQLNVVRILGLSGYNAGPAWYIKDNQNKVIAVLRSRGHYEKYGTSTNESGCTVFDGYDKLVFDAVKVEIGPYKTANGAIGCTGITWDQVVEEQPTGLTAYNLGRFTVKVTPLGETGATEYAVSLNPEDKDYILTVLGTNPFDASSLVYVEELYDVAHLQSIEDGATTAITTGACVCIKAKKYVPVTEPVADFLTVPEEGLKKKNFGKRYIADENSADVLSGATKGEIYEVKYENNAYKYEKDTGVTWSVSAETGATSAISENIAVVYVESIDRYVDSGATIVREDLNNYKERFRPALTPWFVSQLLGEGGKLNVKKLFRFVTISDGNAANEQFKISIEKILPDEGKFDVVVRDYADSDLEPIVLERFSKCTLDPSSSNFIAKKIGTADGDFELKSAYVMVELADDDTISGLVPCGFVGYPMRKVKGNDNTFLPLKYNTELNNEIRPRKQYFGMSDLVGVDVDVLNYKGLSAYFESETEDNGYSQGFHLDSRVSYSGSQIFIGEEEYKFDGVDINLANAEGATEIPVVTNEAEMELTIYGDLNVRKFTVYPYGGFDGWDIYRGQRTNTDEFKGNKYKGKFVNGEGENFTRLFEKTSLDLDGVRNAINSDFYAYLAGYRQFSNPEAVDINLFATPGIDIVNNTLLVDEVLNILEDFEDGRNGDALYVVTTPDKPAGASDRKENMYTPDEVVELVRDTTISDSYVATYWPWVKYYDRASETYIMLPPTKDAMRNFAYVDNNSAPWFAAAGTKEDNGAVNCVKAHRFTKKGDENVLYGNSINPVVTFAQDGVKIWGNKTLYFPDEETPLTRINVRRLMLRVKKLVATSGRVLVFDQNDGTLERQFRSIVEPILANVRSNRGITDFRVDVLNSAECDAEHELQAAIHIKPTPTMEWLSIGFKIYPSCVQFTD